MKKLSCQKSKKNAQNSYQVISKGLSIGIIGGSLILKVPLIITILRKGSAEGLSFGANFTELLTFILTAGYNFHFGYNLSTYAESIILALELLVVFFLMYKYRQISFLEFGIVLVTSGIIVFGFLKD